MKEMNKILTPVGMLGYGFPEADFWRGINLGVDAIVVDAGSTDPGPYQLGLGKMIVAPSALERDLRVCLAGVVRARIPLLISSAGGPGINEHVDATVEMIGRIGREMGQRLKVAAIYSDVKPELVRERLTQGRIVPCASAPQLTAADIDDSTHIVAQMGYEPILKVLREHPDVRRFNFSIDRTWHRFLLATSQRLLKSSLHVGKRNRRDHDIAMIARQHPCKQFMRVAAGNAAGQHGIGQAQFPLGLNTRGSCHDLGFHTAHGKALESSYR